MSENVEEIKADAKEDANSFSSDEVSTKMKNSNDSPESLDTQAKDDLNSDDVELENENVENINSKAKEEKSEEDSFKDKFYYLAAEMDNMKKRFAREKENLIKFGNEKVLSSLLDVVDNLDRTMSAVANEEDEKIKQICTGIEMVQTQFLGVLKKNGLEIVETIGKTFDPNYHEAMAQQPAENKEHHEIITEYQKGYLLNGRLLRPAKVVIANNES